MPRPIPARFSTIIVSLNVLRLPQLTLASISRLFLKKIKSLKLVPGAGGDPFENGWDQNPTYIVVNHLYDNHGSINLVLHEHAHALDSTRSLREISNSTRWKAIALKPKTSHFLTDICGNYCTDNINEGFAELFAYYYACQSTREEIEKNLPPVAKFFKELI
jgi:hypothetical protein